ncbi:MAG: GNAT family N-acetyltransferase [Sphingomonas sp.]|uniref:GNAT family N-acetyltransferase n=1 Tax=Sphingomonas sp. TaxID=28214 RepID=UPI003F81C15C
MRIERDDVSRPAVVALIDYHLRSMHEISPPDSVFALDLSGLKHRDVTFWTIWEGDDLLGMGGLKQLDAAHGEIKSMRTAPTALRRGVAGAMLDHIIGEARARSYRRLSLETDSNAPFAPAWAMYERAGFVPCGPFGSYSDTSFSRYFTRTL